MDVYKFSSFFSNCSIEAVPGRYMNPHSASHRYSLNMSTPTGRSYPVKVHHSKQTQIMTKSGPTNNYVAPAVNLICDLHLRCSCMKLFPLYFIYVHS